VSLISVVQSVALKVGLSSPSAVASSTDRSDQEMLAFANEVGKDIARRVDWNALYAQTDLAGVGTTTPIDLPADFDHLVPGSPVTNAANGVIRPLTREEWPTANPTGGTPRYFLLQGTSLRFYPYLDTGLTVRVRYQSTDWVTDGTTTAAAFTADAETTRFPEIVLEKGLHAYWRRQKGMPYQDQDADFEATLAQYANLANGSRI
jgi:hypothetical protein